MSGEDGLPELAEQLEQLPAQPVSAHPQALETVHRALVAELERLDARRA